jgi:hypothetical protein
MIALTFPNATKGIPYNECVEISGTLPIKLLSSNVEGVKIVGNMLCVSIASPQSDIDIAVSLQGACTTCKPVTASGGIVVSAGGCECTPVSIQAQTVPTLVLGEDYYAAIEISGTGPFEFCGASVPRCMNAKISGNIVTISGKPEVAGAVIFSVKSTCEPCSDCVTFRID